MKKQAAGKNRYADLLATSAKDKWETIGLKRRAGILAPLFSVYSENSAGIADFEDLKLLVDFAAKTGNSLIQLLPMNEVGSLFCPYDSMSSFALEPAYLCLERLELQHQPEIKSRIEEIKNKFPRSGTYLDYGIKKEKEKLLWDMFRQEELRGLPQFRQFREENSYWINDFALYKVLKDYHNGKSWYEWDEEYKNRDSRQIETFCEEHEKEFLFQIWIQWQIYGQFKQARDYAHSRGVLIMGDFPLLVSRDSADAWAHPEFFRLDYSAGAPPDMYCAKGQRWGTPPYNWGIIAGDNYRYLKQKLKFSGNFYDLLRIDHVVGLFRIWTIPYSEPLENQGLHGFYWPRDEKEWSEHGRKILSVINDSTPMLLCAEDLGTIPKVCTQALNELGIPGNDVQRWTKDWKVKHDFLAPGEYRAASVAVLSNHDTTSWPAWWDNEAGTVDEELFISKCSHRGIDYNALKDRLFDFSRSRHARLRWLEGVSSADILVNILGKKREELADFIDMYKNSCGEKEKLWSRLKLKGKMREEADAEIMAAALKIALDSAAIFSIQTIIDYLGMADILSGDHYQYRINTPGTISDKNWSLVIPIPLEGLLKHNICSKIKTMVTASHR